MLTGLHVFVGSTFSDLKPYRVAVQNTLHRMQVIVHGMEYFGSQPGAPKDECLRTVSLCQLYIGVVAMRYGSIDPATGKSLTELEYEEAQRLRLPSLIYILDEETQPVLAKHHETGESATKLQRFKALLKSRHIISQFTTPEDLARQIAVDLPAVAARNDLGIPAAPAEKSSKFVATVATTIALQAANDAVADHRLNASFWVVYLMGVPIKSPITHLMYTTLTNTDPVTSMISSYSVEGRCKDEQEWQQVARLPATTSEFFYVGRGFHAASRIEFSEIFDVLISNVKILGYDLIRGWLFLEVPNDLVGKKLHWRLRIVEVTGAEHVCPVRQLPTATHESLQSASFKICGQRDISDAKTAIYSVVHWR